MSTAEKVMHTFDVKLSWDDIVKNGLISSGNRSPLVFGPPPEFKGKDSQWSPEHLLVAALAGCYTTTFFYFTNLLKVPVRHFSLAASVDFEKGESGILEAQRFHLFPVVEFEKFPGQSVTDNLFEKAKKYCFISRSVKGEVVVKPVVNGTT